MCFGDRQAANVAGALRFVQGLAHWRTTAQQSEIAAAINGPTCCSLEAKQFNDFSRAGVGVCVSGRGAPASEAKALGPQLRALFFLASIAMLNCQSHCVAGMTLRLRDKKLGLAALVSTAITLPRGSPT